MSKNSAALVAIAGLLATPAAFGAKLSQGTVTSQKLVIKSKKNRKKKAQASVQRESAADRIDALAARLEARLDAHLEARLAALEKPAAPQPEPVKPTNAAGIVATAPAIELASATPSPAASSSAAPASTAAAMGSPAPATPPAQAPANSQSVTTAAPSSPTPAKSRYSVKSVFEGVTGALTDLGSVRQPSPHRASEGDPIYARQTLTISYKLDDRYSVSGSFRAQLNAVIDDKGGLMVTEPWFTVSDSKLIVDGAYTMSAYLRYFMPTSNSSRSILGTGKIRFAQSQNYDVPNSRYSLGLDTFAQMSLYALETANNIEATRFAFYAAPAVNYKVSDSLTVGLTYEMANVQMRSTSLLEFVPDGTMLSPNLSWDITPSINFNPAIGINTGGKVSLDTTQFTGSLTIKLL